MRPRIWLVLVCSLAVSLLVVGGSLAQQSAPSDDEVNAIAKQLYCPVCENTPLDVCPTQACAQWRALIREKLAQGWSEDEIKQYFVSQYGDRVLAAPPVRGINLNLLAYVVPPVIILGGVFVLYRVFREWKRPLPPVILEEDKAIPDDEYVARLEEELRQR